MIIGSYDLLYLRYGSIRHPIALLNVMTLKFAWPLSIIVRTDIIITLETDLDCVSSCIKHEIIHSFFFFQEKHYKFANLMFMFRLLLQIKQFDTPTPAGLEWQLLKVCRVDHNHQGQGHDSSSNVKPDIQRQLK